MCSKLYHMYTLYQVQYKGILGLNLTWCLIICFPKILLEVWDKEKRFFFLNIWLKRKKKKEIWFGQRGDKSWSFRQIVILKFQTKIPFLSFLSSLLVFISFNTSNDHASNN